MYFFGGIFMGFSGLLSLKQDRLACVFVCVYMLSRDFQGFFFVFMF